MAAGEPVIPPRGLLALCGRNRGFCPKTEEAASPLTLDAEKWAELNRVNDWVNRNIPARRDLDPDGRPRERWTVASPETGGDCEDLALAKRQALIARGWPPAALLMAVALTWQGTGHAVLLVRTDRGDLVMDNLDWRIRPWAETGYRWTRRQDAAWLLAWRRAAIHGDGE
jgi:predicted transglutaminase-like cysteine proteinase